MIDPLFAPAPRKFHVWLFTSFTRLLLLTVILVQLGLIGYLIYIGFYFFAIFPFMFAAMFAYFLHKEYKAWREYLAVEDSYTIRILES